VIFKIMVAPIKHLNYKFETGKMFDEYFKNIDHFTEHEDIPDEYKKEFKSFKYLRADRHDLPILTAECKRFVDHFGLHGYDINPRYYLCEAGGRFPPHKDMKTLCAVNHILSDRYAPLVIEGDEYLYKTAIIDLQREHHVVNYGYEARMLLKLSVFDLSYEDMIAKLSTSLDPDPFNFSKYSFNKLS